jgi:hypothetical protein
MSPRMTSIHSKAPDPVAMFGFEDPDPRMADFDWAFVPNDAAINLSQQLISFKFNLCSIIFCFHHLTIIVPHILRGRRLFSARLSDQNFLSIFTRTNFYQTSFLCTDDHICCLGEGKATLRNRVSSNASPEFSHQRQDP